jgi:hypothetical protein
VDTVRELDASVKERLQISHIRDDNAHASASASGGFVPSASSTSKDMRALLSAQRMQAIVERRRLVDLAKVQSEEVKVLRAQLEALRRRTFASFAEAPKQPPGIDPPPCRAVFLPCVFVILTAASNVRFCR